MLPPLPPGFTSRHGRLDDVAMAAEMGRQYALASTGFSDVDADTLRNQWQNPGFDPAQDLYFVFSPDDQLVGYYEVWALGDPPVHPYIWGVVAIDHQGLGIGTHMLAWAEQRARHVLDQVPAEARVAPVVSFPHQIEQAKTLFENNAWTYLRSSYTMRIDFDAPPPAPVFPPNLTIRTYQPEYAEAIYRSMDEAFSDHFGHVDAPFEVGFARFKHSVIEDPLFDGSLWLTAWDGDEIAGICLNRVHAYDDPECGYVNTLGVRRPWRKQGLGLALLRQSFCEFYVRGYRKVSLGVDAFNLTGALRLYENAGMRVVRHFDQYEKELRPGRELRVQ